METIDLSVAKSNEKEVERIIERFNNLNQENLKKLVKENLNTRKKRN